jgi:DNA-directed RNA polymerase specialized sigma24 family protein
MSGQLETHDLAVFESHRPALLALAYRMLGDVGRAQDTVQEAWLRWHQRDVAVDSPKAFLVTVVTRLCLNELGSARARREESRGDRLPEPVDLEEGGMARLEELERRSRPLSRAARPHAESCSSARVRRSLPGGGLSPQRGRSTSGCWAPFSALLPQVTSQGLWVCSRRTPS